MRYHELPTLDDHELVGNLTALEEELDRRAGSYRYLCRLKDTLIYAHSPIGRVVRRIRRKES